MMPLLLLFFGLLGDCLLAVLVGMLGASRRLGFGWSFLISLLFTPFVGLLCVLLSEQLPAAAERRWGCLGTLCAGLGCLCLLIFLFLLLTGGAALATLL